LEFGIYDLEFDSTNVIKNKKLSQCRQIPLIQTEKKGINCNFEPIIVVVFKKVTGYELRVTGYEFPNNIIKGDM